jgi:HEAT repeat protein
MPVTREEVVTALLPDEPQYDEAARWGADALPHLSELVRGDDANLASKAASLAVRIRDEASLRVLSEAAEHAHPVVRIAAAGELWRLGSLGIGPIVLKLLADPDPQVRLLAVTSAIRVPEPADVQDRLEAIALRDPVPDVRARAADALRRTGRLDRLRDLVKHGRRDI